MSRARLAPLLLLIASVACAPVDPLSMIALPPPRNWVDDLGELRRSRDDYFSRSPETPLMPDDVASFEGLDYWAPDGDYFFVGSVNLYPQPERLTIVTTNGKTRPGEKIGWIRFTIDGMPQTLQVYHMLDSGQAGLDSLLVPFRDATTGVESYPAGRYIDLRGPAGGPYVLDFNRAYNPSCAYGDLARFTCPVAPAENTLQVRIEAGERGFKHPPASEGTPES